MLLVIRTVVILGGGYLLEGVRRETSGQTDYSLFLDLGMSYMDALSLWKFTEFYTMICVFNFLEVEKQLHVYFYFDYFICTNSVKLINLNNRSLDSCEVFTSPVISSINYLFFFFLAGRLAPEVRAPRGYKLSLSLPLLLRL